MFHLNSEDAQQGYELRFKKLIYFLLLDQGARVTFPVIN